MQIQFLGATGTVTGSKYLLTHNHHRVLLDCGLFQGRKELRLRNWQSLPIPARTIDAVLLTHAHLDHTGYLPLLVKQGFRGPVYATAATCALCRVLLPDSGHLQEEDAAFANRHGFSKHRPALPLYTREDAVRALASLRPVRWEDAAEPIPGVRAVFRPVGHILGASMIELTLTNGRVTFSGDVGRMHHPIMAAPTKLAPTDCLVLESTYGDRNHPTHHPREALAAMISRAVARGGSVLIPSFAVGRAQELLFLIWQLQQARAIPVVPVYVNSPMAIEATRLYHEFPAEHTIPPDAFAGMERMTRFVTTIDESKRLNAPSTPSIIISASGMATGGRVLHHLKAMASDPKHLIVFAGYQAMGTRGEAMIHGATQVKIHGTVVPIRAEVQQLAALSGHADATELLDWLRPTAQSPHRVFLTHGEPSASEALRKRIVDELHWPCELPEMLREYHVL